ncbi:MAG: hypothetical protein ABSG95_14835 [Solirubrobacteraceae bacterium]
MPPALLRADDNDEKMPSAANAATVSTSNSDLRFIVCLHASACFVSVPSMFSTPYGDKIPDQARLQRVGSDCRPRPQQPLAVGVPALSSATFVGESTHPGEGIEAVEPPTLYTLEAPSDIPNVVHLHWQQVPGAEGYEVFSTPTLDTPFRTSPDAVSAIPGGAMVTELPSSATNAYIAGAGSEQRHYAVSSIVGKEPVLDHPVLTANSGGPTAPEFGRCAKVPAEKEGKKTVYKGGYTASTCLETSATHTGKYEWSSGVIKAGFTTAGSSSVTLETLAKAKLTCTAESGEGSITSAKTVGNVIVRLKGCESSGHKCTSSGLGEGDLESEKLEGVLVWETKASKKVALDLYPVGKTGPQRRLHGAERLGHRAAQGGQGGHHGGAEIQGEQRQAETGSLRRRRNGRAAELTQRRESRTGRADARRDPDYEELVEINAVA